MSGTAAQNAIAVVGVDIGKNSFHVVGLDDRGAMSGIACAAKASDNPNKAIAIVLTIVSSRDFRMALLDYS
jgi:hypothetical protein